MIKLEQIINGAKASSKMFISDEELFDAIESAKIIITYFENKESILSSIILCHMKLELENLKRYFDSRTSRKEREIWRILKNQCGAHQSLEYSFIDFYRKNYDKCNEFRFGGILGFGGKLYTNKGKAYVGCYSEDCDEGRSMLITEVNNKLGEICE